MKIIKSVMADVVKKNNMALLTLSFADGKGGEYSWAPQWESVRQLFMAAILVEFANTLNQPTIGELQTFEESLKAINATLQTIIGFRYGQFCIEASPDWLKEQARKA